MKEKRDILEQMFAETRETPADDRVPYAFEKRIMAHLKDTPEPALNLWEQWSRLLWRAVVPSAAVMVLVAIFLSPAATDNSNPNPAGAASGVATTEPVEKDDLEGVVLHSLEATPDE